MEIAERDDKAAARRDEPRNVAEARVELWLALLERRSAAGRSATCGAEANHTSSASSPNPTEHIHCVLHALREGRAALHEAERIVEKVRDLFVSPRGRARSPLRCPLVLKEDVCKGLVRRAGNGAALGRLLTLEAGHLRLLFAE